MSGLYGDGLVPFHAESPQPNQTAVGLVPSGVNTRCCRDVPQAVAAAKEASSIR